MNGIHEHNEGGLARFRRMHSATLREFAARWPEEYQVKAREAGGTGRGLELLERIDREPMTARPQPGMGMWRAFTEYFGRGRE